MASQTAKTCAHPACSCMVTGSDEFCGDGCQRASKDVATNDTCDCNHPACGR